MGQSWRPGSDPRSPKRRTADGFRAQRATGLWRHDSGRGDLFLRCAVLQNRIERIRPFEDILGVGRIRTGGGHVAYDVFEIL
jgi:hypothetical protein